MRGIAALKLLTLCKNKKLSTKLRGCILHPLFLFPIIINKNMKTFIEFGAPFNMNGLESTPYNITIAKKEGYRTIAIDFERQNFHTTTEYTKVVDETYYNFWSDDIDIPLADKWISYSSLEHCPKERVLKEVEGIAKKVSGVGEISIDLSNHGDGYSYLNNIQPSQWRDIMNNFFIYIFKEDLDNEMIYFKNCKATL